MGRRRRRPRGRALDGIFLLDKPADRSSNAAMQRVRLLFNGGKAGHGGNLDPLASGMLPIVFGEATKFANGLLEAEKQYRAVAKLGARSTTGDLEGECFDHKPIPEDLNKKLDQVLSQFRGAITQTPPMHSAIKRDGVPLYELARAGVTVERAERHVTISKLECIAQTQDRLTLRIGCSKGTYIRSLVEDIGSALRCNAHVETLRRERVQPFEQADMITLDELESARDRGPPESLDRMLLPIDGALVELPIYRLDSARECDVFQHGNLLDLRGQPAGDERPIRVYYDGDFLGTAVCRAGRLHPARLLKRPY